MCRVHVSQTSYLFANSGSEDQGRGVESELLGLKIGGQNQDFGFRMDESFGQESRAQNCRVLSQFLSKGITV